METRVPFVDLGRVNHPHKDEMLAKLGSIIDRSAFVLGEEVEELEAAFAAYVGVRHAVGVSNGLDAITLALRAAGVGPGDEVVTQANTFIATVYAISAAGATPVLADVEPDTFNLSPEAAARAVTPRTRAIIPVHLFGQPATIKPLQELSAGSGGRIALIEDSAQAHGARYQGKTCGSLGRLGCFSFYPGKNLGSLGEGGAVTTDDPALAERVRILRNVGQRTKNIHEAIAGNFRLHNLQAALLTIKLRGLDAANAERVRAAGAYDRGLAGIDGLALPRRAPDRTHVYHLYVVALRDPADRDRLQAHLAADGIQTGIHYPAPVHLQPCYASLGKGPGSFPVAERLCRSILSLPMFPGMTDGELELVISSVRRFFRC